jgi:hypothetical protein
MKLRGRKPSTGRFSSREELTSFTWQRWLITQSSITDIAVAARVSPGVVHLILTKLEGRPDIVPLPTPTLLDTPRE